MESETFPRWGPVTEPATMLTDYALAASALYFASGVHGALPPDRIVAQWFWVLGFATFGLAALTGGTMHGFRLAMGEPARKALWNVTVTLIATGGVLFVSAGAASGLSRSGAAAAWMLAGICVSAAGVAVVRARLGLHTHLNHNDVYHLIQIAGFYLIYRGVLEIGGI